MEVSWKMIERHERDVATQAAEAERAAVVGERAIDAAAKYLRETNQAGKRLTPWEETPKSTKRKWLALAEGALRAAIESGQRSDPVTSGNLTTIPSEAE